MGASSPRKGAASAASAAKKRPKPPQRCWLKLPGELYDKIREEAAELGGTRGSVQFVLQKRVRLSYEQEAQIARILGSVHLSSPSPPKGSDGHD